MERDNKKKLEEEFAHVSRPPQSKKHKKDKKATSHEDMEKEAHAMKTKKTKKNDNTEKKNRQHGNTTKDTYEEYEDVDAAPPKVVPAPPPLVKKCKTSAEAGKTSADADLVNEFRINHEKSIRQFLFRAPLPQEVALEVKGSATRQVTAKEPRSKR